MTSFNLVFAGTPPFAAVILNALLKTSHKIKAVYTQPDREAGRGQKIQASPVKVLALEHGIPVCQPKSLKSEESSASLLEWQPDLMVVVAYGLILPKAILSVPKLGCLNVHASLLPRWRGAAPIQRAILEGDAKTGITIMQMEEGLDTGPMFYSKECEITNNDTSGSLHDKLAILGAEALIYALENLAKLQPHPQPCIGVTYAQKIKKEEGRLNWNLTAVELDRQIRAFNPWPVAFAGPIRVWKAEVVSDEVLSQPGLITHVSSKGIEVATGKGVLRLLDIQLPGGKILPVKEILNSRKEFFKVGVMLRDNDS